MGWNRTGHRPSWPAIWKILLRIARIPRHPASPMRVWRDSFCTVLARVRSFMPDLLPGMEALANCAPLRLERAAHEAISGIVKLENRVEARALCPRSDHETFCASCCPV